VPEFSFQSSSIRAVSQAEACDFVENDNGSRDAIIGESHSDSPPSNENDRATASRYLSQQNVNSIR